ncbi:hypothetical protein HEO82_011985, partial [Escherichia coli]|nr:hypothetical protein [Escherichia coli]
IYSHMVTFWGNYEGISQYLTWNDGHKNYTASFKVGYKMGSWIPYMSIADYKGVDKTSSNRQIRWRWGLTYTF